MATDQTTDQTTDQKTDRTTDETTSGTGMANGRLHRTTEGPGGGTSDGKGDGKGDGMVADVVVVGGGLGGLVAAADAARAGASVVLVEAREAGGGRARSDRVDGFVVNHGAHALYRTGAARAILDDLGVAWKGRRPRVHGSAWVADGERVSWLRPSGVGGVRGLRALARAATSKADLEHQRGRSFGEWLAEQPEAARPAIVAAVRTSTYQADLDACDAHAILTQLHRGAKGVLYLDGGWQSLVDGLERVVEQAGVRRLVAKATAVRPVADGAAGDRDRASRDGGGAAGREGGRDGGRWVVETAAGPVDAGAVVIAVGGPAEADRLLGGASKAVARWAASADPVVASTLEVLLRRRPKRRVAAYGLGEPTYSVDHAATCWIAPAGGALVHGLFYEPDRLPDVDPRVRLEETLDAWQPGWREHVVDVVERKRMVVAHDRPRLAPKADLAAAVVPDLDGVYLASDAVTAEGLLADAATSSGRKAGRAAAARAATHRASSARLARTR